jgi:hypothetical protein
VKTGFVINPYGAEISQAQAPTAQSVHCASSYFSLVRSYLSLYLHPQIAANRALYTVGSCVPNS